MENMEGLTLRFYSAVVLFVVSALALIVGFGQQVFWRAPSTITQTVSIENGGSATAPITVIDGGTLKAHDGKATITVDGPAEVFAAVAPTDDVNAWVADAQSNHVTGTDADLSVSSEGSEATTPNPVGSDLWIQEQSGLNQLQLQTEPSANSSVIIASNGTDAAPSAITVSWPNENPRPWAFPLVVAGYLLLIAGFVLLLIEVISNRRGPRRRSHRGARLDRSDVSELKTRRRHGGSTRSVLAVGAAVAVTVALTGCSSTSPIVSATNTAQAPAETDVEAPPVSKAHFQTILSEIVSVSDTADAALSADTLSQRFAGEAYASRVGYYDLKSKYADKTAIDPIVADQVPLFLPQTGSDFPRTVIVGVKGAADDAQPTLMVLQQATARENYKVLSVLSHVSSLPDMPSDVLGSNVLGDDTTQLSVAPKLLGEQFGDVLANGPDSAYAAKFNLDDSFQFIAQRRQAVADQNATEGFADNATLTVNYGQGQSDPVAMTTADGDGLVVISLDETWTIKPKESNGVIKDLPAEDAAVLGKSETSKGLERTYSTSLAFTVPKSGDQQIQLVGFSWVLSSIKELE